jgi:aminoglycoside phosphotransferase (APT) family kinase protein
MAVLDAAASQIERRFGECLGLRVRLTGRKLAGEGLSDETAILTFDHDGSELRLVVRLFRPGAMARHEVDPHRLHRLLAALGATIVPVPQALWFDSSADLFGAAYSVVSWLPGRSVVPWSREGREFLADAGSTAISKSFSRILADIHSLDWSDLGLDLLGSPPVDFAAAKIAELEDYLDRVRAEPEPILVDSLGWLRANRPHPDQITLVHGDYRTGNMLFDGGDISAVLDWEFAMLGDPLFDLGWTCCPSNRVGSELVCYLQSEEAFISGYEQHRGRPVDRDALRFWVVFHQVRHALMWLDAGRNVQTGATDDLRLARMHYTMPTMRKMVADLLEYP